MWWLERGELEIELELLVKDMQGMILPEVTQAVLGTTTFFDLKGQDIGKIIYVDMETTKNYGSNCFGVTIANIFKE